MPRSAWLALPRAGDVEREIGALIDALARSDCRFERNGDGYDAAPAREHLQRKYAWLRKRGLANDAEQFIDRAAGRSSVRGRDDHVRCGTQRTTTASAWSAQAQRRIRMHSP